MELDILYEDAHVIVVVKPPKIPSQSDKTKDKDMITLLKEYLSEKHKVINPYIGLIHRLDRPVGGVMVYAKTKYANAILSEQIRKKEIIKKYYVVVNGIPKEKESTLNDYLIKQTNNVSRVVKKDVKEAKEAILNYELIDSIKLDNQEQYSLLVVELITGRHHQIRVQLSNANIGIWGDTKYNKLFVNKKGWYQIALFSYYVEFKHPKTNKKMVFSSKPKEYPFDLFVNYK